MKRSEPATTPAAAPAPAEAQTRADGRHNRSVVTRKKIVDALTELVYEGHIAPTAQQVAERAQIGLRTVFRHFDDMDSLYKEISMDLDALVKPLLQVRLSAATWQERLLESIEPRIEIYDRLAAMFVGAQVHRHESAFLAQNLMDSAQLQRDLLRRLLPQEVSRDATLLDALDLVMSFDSWIRLRREQGLDTRKARSVVHLAVKSLLAGAGH